MNATEQQTEPKQNKPAERIKHTTLAAALVAAQAAAKSVGKDATNKYHGYNYASAEAIMAEAREALNSAGLATIMRRWEIEPPKEPSGVGMASLSRVLVHFVTFHADSEQTLEDVVPYPIIPEKGRPEDKATATALTYAAGYYLRGLLCLPRVAEYEDVDQRDDSGYQPRGQQQPARRNENRPRPQSGPKEGGNGANGHGDSKPASKPPQDLSKTWEAKVTTCANPSQLRTMATALRSNTQLAEADRTRLVEMAERKAEQADQAAAKVGAER